MKKIIFLDIDGTILPEGKTQVKQNLIDGIKKVHEAGNIVFICTGRNAHAAEDIINQLEINNYVTSNGQKVVMEGEVKFNHHIRRDEINYVVESIKKHTNKYAVEDDYGLKTPATEDGQELANLIKGHGFAHVESTNNIDLDKIYQLWAFGTKEEVDKVQMEVDDKVDCYRWTENAMEIATKDYGKGIGIRQVVNIINENVQTYGFGDGVNDFSMMKEVDVAVAMGNAHPDLKKICDIVIGNCEEDGLVLALEDLGLMKKY